MSSPLVLVGPTASGKSDVAMAFAAAETNARRPVEIIVVDAMQVYRGLSIGTAKPDAADRSVVPHHGLDLVGPDRPFAVGEYAPAMRAAIADVERRGARPLLVAGTGLYLRALVDDVELPGSYPDVRVALEAEAEAEAEAAAEAAPRRVTEYVAAPQPDRASTTSAMYARLCELDPLAASRIEPGNLRRVVRALEVCIGSGRPFSSFGPGMDHYPPTRYAQIGLRWPRAVLAARIEARVSSMLAAGWLDEVRALRGGPRPSRTAAQALGYRELLAHLDGDMSLAEATAEIVLRTRQFAVRQERWFRRDPRIQWVDIQSDPVGEVLPVLSRWATA